MKIARNVLAVVLAVFPAVWAGAALAADAEQVPLQTERLGKRVLVLYANERACRMTAIATERGLVVIDTGRSPTLARRYRAAIEETFGRSDFKWVINTHHHYDHFGGNQVFPEATIVGHEAGVADVRRMAEDVPGFVAGLRERSAGLRQRLSEMDPGSTEARRLQAFIELDELAVDDMESGFTPLPPTVTFDNRLTLEMGDLTVELFHYGPAHSGSDIIVRVPEERLVVVGHLYPSGLLGLAGPGMRVEVPRWIEVLDTVLAGEGPAHVVEGHRPMTVAELKARRDYIGQLWNEVTEARREGLDLDAVSARLALDDDFAYLGEYFDLDDPQVRAAHRYNVRTFWGSLFDDGAAAIAEMIDDQGVEAARALFAGMRGDDTGRYFLDEVAFNALGYRLLAERRFLEAFAIFEMNVEAHPESWNVHDSLGEVYLLVGDEERARASYERSLELNPDNDNGRRVIDEIRGTPTDDGDEATEPPG